MVSGLHVSLFVVLVWSALRVAWSVIHGSVDAEEIIAAVVFVGAFLALRLHREAAEDAGRGSRVDVGAFADFIVNGRSRFA